MHFPIDGIVAKWKTDSQGLQQLLGRLIREIEIDAVRVSVTTKGLTLP